MLNLNSLECELPRFLDPVETDSFVDQTAHPAAVMILFTCEDNQWNIVYTRRTDQVSTHQGEVSFPGGGYENGDSSLLDTALREVEEEIGITRQDISVSGRLSVQHTLSGFLVFPFVGILRKRVAYKINPIEVERVFTIPLSWLMDTQHVYEKDHSIYGKRVRKVLHYQDYEGEHLWGLSARMTQELINRITR